MHWDVANVWLRLLLLLLLFFNNGLFLCFKDCNLLRCVFDEFLMLQFVARVKNIIL